MLKVVIRFCGSRGVVRGFGGSCRVCLCVGSPRCARRGRTGRSRLGRAGVSARLPRSTVWSSTTPSSLSTTWAFLFISGQVPETPDGTAPEGFDAQCCLAWRKRAGRPRRRRHVRPQPGAASTEHGAVVSPFRSQDTTALVPASPDRPGSVLGGVDVAQQGLRWLRQPDQSSGSEQLVDVCVGHRTPADDDRPQRHSGRERLLRDRRTGGVAELRRESCDDADRVPDSGLEPLAGWR